MNNDDMLVQQILESFLKSVFALRLIFLDYVTIRGISFIKGHKEHILELKLILSDLIMNEI
jgi:hypothetical protein